MFTQVEKHMQMLKVFRYSATVKSNISLLYKFDLLKSTIMRKFRSLSDRVNVTAVKTVLEIVF